MYESLLIFVVFVAASVIWSAFGFNIVSLGQHHFIKNEKIVLGGFFTLLGACTISWGMFVVLGIINLAPRIVAILQSLM